MHRICDNLSVQRDAQDVEIHAKVCEVRDWIELYEKPYGSVGSETQV